MGRSTNGRGYTNSHTQSVRTNTPRNQSQQTKYNPSFYRHADRQKSEADLMIEHNPLSLLMLHGIVMNMR